MRMSQLIKYTRVNSALGKDTPNTLCASRSRIGVVSYGDRGLSYSRYLTVVSVENVFWYVTKCITDIEAFYVLKIIFIDPRLKTTETILIKICS